MLEKELENIIRNKQDVLPFLKKLSPKEKRELAPSVIRLHEEIHKTKEERRKDKDIGYSYVTLVPIHSEEQRKAMDIACFVCLNKTKARKVLFNLSSLAVDDYYLEHVIPWYKPKWYSEIIQQNIPWNLSYEKMMHLYDQGILELSQELILNKLPGAIVENKGLIEGRYVSFYRPEVLTQYEETLKEHIWFLFEEESSINNYYNYQNLQNYDHGNSVWIDTLVNLTNKNKLDRDRILITTIYTATKGFNKTLSCWFFDLLIKLNPTEEELLHLQDELFTTLNSPHSKLINNVLKFFKLIGTHKDFQYESFIENASILLTSETKSVVNSTLMILDKIAKTQKTTTISACRKATEALIMVDEKVQLRASKLIAKYGDVKNEELIEEINLYADSMFHSSKELLSDYLAPAVIIEDAEEEIVSIDVLSDESKIPTYESIDDLIFFLSQAIDNNEVYHLDLVLNLTPKLNTLLNKDNVVKLEPIFKRSLDFSMRFDLTSQIGYLDREISYYINDFAEFLMKKYPKELSNFKKVKKEKLDKILADKYFRNHYKDKLNPHDLRPIWDNIYQIHDFLFGQSQMYIKQGITIDLLSTPTHTPCWIHPDTFLKRLRIFIEGKHLISVSDFQIALGRIPIQECSEETLKLLELIKDDEAKEVLLYHFGKLSIEDAAILRPDLWLQSVLSKNRPSDIEYFQQHLNNCLEKETGIYEWDCKTRDHFYQEYDYNSNKHVEKKIVRKELKLQSFNKYQHQPDSFVDGIKRLFGKKKKRKEVVSIYNHMSFGEQKYGVSIAPHDDIRFLYLSPNNPSMFLSHVLHHNMNLSTFWGESSKRNMVNLLKGLYEIWYRSELKETTYLFLATGFLCSDKVSRELAAEIWIKANYDGTMNNTLLGECLGRLQHGEYAPMKRFTDLLTNLFNVSKAHNQALFQVLDTMTAKMNATPPRGVKKQLEVLFELKSKLNVELTESVKEKLTEWISTKSLQSIIQKLIS